MRKRPFVHTSLNARANVLAEEFNDGTVVTVPDQSMTVQEILQRHVRGLPLSVNRFPIYQDEDDDTIMDDWRSLDLTEQQDIIDEIARIPQLQKKLQDEIEKRKIGPGKAAGDTVPPAEQAGEVQK